MTEFFNFLKTEYQKKNNNFYYYDSTGAVETPENSQIEWASHGATKVAFKLKSSPSDVIKIPLKGWVDEENNIIPMENYCEIEFKNYQIAKEMGVHNFLSPIKKITNQIYIQNLIIKKLTSILISVDTEILKWFNNRNLTEITSQITAATTLTLFKEQYSLMELEKFNLFLKKTKINDLTVDNIGLDINNKAVLFDYSGYKGD